MSVSSQNISRHNISSQNASCQGISCQNVRSTDLSGPVALMSDISCQKY